MNKLLTLAAIALTVASCSKKDIEQPAPPIGGEMDQNAPISFGANADLEIISKATTSSILGDGANSTLKMDSLAIYAFRGKTLPADPSAAATVLWCDATNVSYHYFSDGANKYYKENPYTGAKPKVFWPGSGTTDPELSFTSYFPRVNTGTAMPVADLMQAYVKDYVLNANLTDQLTKKVNTVNVDYDYGFAWDSLLSSLRADAKHELAFGYKVAKITLVIKGDDATIGDTDEGLQISAGGATDKGLKSVRIYSGVPAALKAGFAMDLLNGKVTASVAAKSPKTADTILVQPKQNAGQSTAPKVKPYIDVMAYLVPATAEEMNPVSGTKGIVVAVVYNDGVKDQTYLAEINQDKLTDGTTTNADAALKNGILAGKNYKYTLKLGKTGITFTGKVTDWVDVPYAPEIPLE